MVACIYKLWIVRISLDWISKVKTNSRHISNVYFLYGESKPNETGQIIWFRAKFNSTGKNIGKSGLDMLGWISNKEKLTHFCLFFQIHHNLVVELKMLYINAEAWLACILSVIEIGIDNTYRYYLFYSVVKVGLPWIKRILKQMLIIGQPLGESSKVGFGCKAILEYELKLASTCCTN